MRGGIVNQVAGIYRIKEALSIKRKNTVSKESFESYWIGKNTNYKEIWSDYEKGLIDYSNKFNSMSVYLLRIKFKYPPSSLPLFNHEVIYKTIKGLFHDIKYICFNEKTYNEMGPLFLYDVHRGSGNWGFLGELIPALLLLWTLRKERSLSMAIKNKDEILEFLKKHFPEASKEVAQRFNNIKSSQDLDDAVSVALSELDKQKIEEIKISSSPFNGQNPSESEKNLIIIPNKENWKD